MTPACFSASAAGVPLAMARASSSRSAVTKLSPALSASFSACFEQARRFRRQIELAGPAAFDLRQLGRARLRSRQGARGIAAGGADQIGRQAFAIVQQDLEKMLGSQPLMAAPLSQGLRGLQEAARALGVFLDVHLFRPLSPRPIRHAGTMQWNSRPRAGYGAAAAPAQERQDGARPTTL